MLVLFMGCFTCFVRDVNQSSYELSLPALMCGDNLMGPNGQSL